MEIRTVAEAIAFSPDKMAKNALFQSPHMFIDMYCLQPQQSQKVHAHDESDKVYFVLEGTGKFTIGDEVQDLGGGQAVIARAGQPHGVMNPGPTDLIMLVTMAPKPGN